ncbi:hypothetical protein P4601_04555 [Peribacillus frigoritolerans]|uniref:hypothetical protein n=1 Tax=Peribacillus frigoritolerans TaxID=450367 RepID=UPI001EFC90B0|nr:hypothetical protein [Peribacillus frigoritolerans]MED3708396.1 hypothetical protein [Peribacillus frigoritolerans]MED3889217.1 hypothetical protein [Peribacillus frigoritolerans]ULM97183.1 hypothetical protein L8956_26190 [Peribacillus frigoritolerans]
MKRLGGLHFLVGIWVPVLLMAQAVIGIMMYVDGSGNEPMNRQAVMGQHAYRNTTESDTEESVSSRTETDDSSTETATNDTQGTPQGGCLMVPELQEKCQAAAVSKAETLLLGNSSTFIKGQVAWPHPSSSL